VPRKPSDPPPKLTGAPPTRGDRPAPPGDKSGTVTGTMTAIRDVIDGGPALKAIEPSAARWIGTLIRVSSAHPAMGRILDVLERLSENPYRTNALVWGEPGTGKGGLARALAQLMAPGRPFIRLDVAGFSEDAAMIALCGHGNRPGAAEQAHGGYLVIEEILGLPVRVQEALLRLFKAGRIRRFGSEQDQPEKLQVGAIALCDGDVEAAVASGRLRHDLYWRLARIALWLPPLRERPEDIPAAAVWMGNRILAAAGVPLELRTTEDLATANPADRRRALELTASAITELAAQSWVGNFRELEATIERALLLYRQSSTITADEIRAAIAAGKMGSEPPKSH
jgi:DNA-binding NtrC family response regulator